jgi:hypothetical protein
MSEVTHILSAINQGDPHAAEQLLPLVYEVLRKLAAQKMAQEASALIDLSIKGKLKKCFTPTGGFMVARGHVQNGVVVLDDGVRLPEGQEVSVLVRLSANEKRHSVLDIPPVSIGAVLRPLTSEEDLLGEMLEARG